MWGGSEGLALFAELFPPCRAKAWPPGLPWPRRRGLPAGGGGAFPHSFPCKERP